MDIPRVLPIELDIIKINTGWRTDEPLKHGYYLATWIRAGVPIVSEFWFNPDSNHKWWCTRRYLGDRPYNMIDHGTIKRGVLAWMPLPVPYDPEKQ